MRIDVNKLRIVSQITIEKEKKIAAINFQNSLTESFSGRSILLKTQKLT
jgi:hypothetical protein